MSTKPEATGHDAPSMVARLRRAVWRHGSACREIAAFFKTLRQTAEQLTPLQRWYRVRSRALVNYLNGRELHPLPRLPAPA